MWHIIAAATLLLDLPKALAAVTIARNFLPGHEALAALGAILGHCFPVWLRFKGGKGVATTMGVCLGLAWPLGLVYAGTWLVMLALTRISSLSGLTAAVAGALAGSALAQGSGSIKIITPFTAGTGYDTIARAVGTRLSEKLGTPVIVQNMPGAGSLTAVRRLEAGMPKDGTAIVTFNPAIYLGLSLGLTFPMNMLVGIPLYTAVARVALG